MTESQIFRSGYLFWAIYASLLPLGAFTVIGVLLVKNLDQALPENLEGVVFLGLWVLSYLIAIPFVRGPFLRSFDKFKLTYTAGKLKNLRGTVDIDKTEIEKIYIGHRTKRSEAGEVRKILNSELSLVEAVSVKNCLTLVLSNQRILFLDLLPLKGGKDLQENILDDNVGKVQNHPYDILLYKKKGNLKWYSVQDDVLDGS